ncbi:MAG: DUF805 domain-containing protein, partial [Ruminococcus sp.]|nr:DUF805 domain-containing protein [Ruminococcus sp.]
IGIAVGVNITGIGGDFAVMLNFAFRLGGAALRFRTLRVVIVIFAYLRNAVIIAAFVAFFDFALIAVGVDVIVRRSHDTAAGGRRGCHLIVLFRGGLSSRCRGRSSGSFAVLIAFAAACQNSQRGDGKYGGKNNRQ